MSSRIPNRDLFGQSLASDRQQQGGIRRGTLQQRVIYPADDPFGAELPVAFNSAAAVDMDNMEVEVD